MKNKLNNKGFSLMELLIVIAVVSIMLAMTGLSIAIINRTNTTKAASNLAAMIREARTTSMAKGPVEGTLTLSIHDGKLYGQIGTSELEEICNAKSIQIYSFANPVDSSINSLTGFTQLGDGASMTYQFNSAGMIVDPTATSDLTFAFTRSDRVNVVTLFPHSGKVKTYMFYK